MKTKEYKKAMELNKYDLVDLLDFKDHYSNLKSYKANLKKFTQLNK